MVALELQTQLIDEIKQIPAEKLSEIYDLIHYFRLGLAQEKPKTESEMAQKVPQFGFAKGMIEMSADFDEPLEEFKDYME